MAGTEAEVVRDLSFEAQDPAELEPGKHYAWFTRDGAVVDRDLSHLLPTFKTGIVHVYDVEAFATYYLKHADEGSEVYADLDAATITAVIDAHTAASDTNNGARWQRHRLVLSMRETLPWQTWVAKDRKPMGQRDFAEFLEDNYRDLAPADDQPKDDDGYPVIDPAGLLELAQKFRATLKATFHEGHQLSNGQTSLSYIEDVSGGHKDDVEAPTEFAVAIAPFDDCDEALIIARFRYRVEREGVTFQYVLTNPDRRRREAVEEIVAKTAEAAGVRIILGQPSS